MCKILDKEEKFIFDVTCLNAFECQKNDLSTWNHWPNWEEAFEVICDVSGITLGVVLGQKIATRCSILFTMLVSP